MFSLITGIIFCVINFLLNYKNYLNLIFFMYILLLAGLSCWFVFPVSTSTGMTNPNVNPINFINLVLVIIFSLILGISSLTIIKKYILIFLTTITLLAVSNSIINIYNSKFNAFNFRDTAKAQNSLEPMKLSNRKNIFVMSFDGVPGNLVAEIIKNDEKLSASFKDFTIFENAISQSHSQQVHHT